MASRCASCSYPLCVSDSVVCYECWSYFHIDCAQLVGFPHYELSSEPSRNRFRCTTCVLLPLPPPQCDSDSDSDCDMPSRQDDCDIAEDMSELKGALQDLSNLCKDMLREINDIKSINLTLRCGIENLRHENEERDKVIADLKHRLDCLENRKTIDYQTDKSNISENVLEKITDVTNEEYESIKNIDSIQERTVNFQETTRQECEEFVQSEVKSLITNEIKESRQDWTWKGSKAVELDASTKQNEEEDEEEGVTEESDVEEETAHGWETLQEELESEYKVKEEVVYTSVNKNIDSVNPSSDEEVLNSEYETDDELLIEKDLHNDEKIKRSEKEDILREEQDLENTNSFQEDDEPEVEDQENTTTTGNECIESEAITQEQAFTTESSYNYLEDRLSDSEEELNQGDTESANIKDIHETKTSELVQPSVSDSCEEDEEDDYENETNSTLKEIRHEDFVEVEVGEIPEEGDNEESILREENEDEEHRARAEDEYRSEPDVDRTEELCDEEDGLHLDEEQTLEDRPDGEERLEESRLEGAAGETGLEGEQRLGGQSLEDGEVQPSEPPPTPPPQHTEEDLWLYLKDAVTSERPATVEEFLQNLIGTLQHVPEEYLQPVIEANIKRANSPTMSTADGEAVRTLEEPVEKHEAVPVEGAQVSEGDAAPQSEDTTAVEEVPPEAEASSPYMEESPSGDADGFSAVEAAA